MALISKEQIRKARKAGFKRKVPKKPKKNASVSAMEGYLERCKDFNSAAALKVKEYSKKESLRKKIHGY